MIQISSILIVIQRGDARNVLVTIKSCSSWRICSMGLSRWVKLMLSWFLPWRLIKILPICSHVVTNLRIVLLFRENSKEKMWLNSVWSNLPIMSRREPALFLHLLRGLQVVLQANLLLKKVDRENQHQDQDPLSRLVLLQKW